MGGLGAMTISLAQHLAPTIAERLGRCRSDLCLGLPVLVKKDDQLALVLAVETLTNSRLHQLSKLIGEPELVLTANRARIVLATQASIPQLNEPVRIQPPTGATADWFRHLADTNFDKAGATGALDVLRDGEMALHYLALTLVKAAELLPAAVLFPIDKATARSIDFDVPQIDWAEARDHLSAFPYLSAVAKARLPIEAHEAGELHVFRDPNGITEHYAMEIGCPDRTAPVLCRVHSACFTGDVLGSLKCDCGSQLHMALALMGEAGAGILLYLNQEGRSIGLANKMRVYNLQAKGLDTVEANHQLGFSDDERDFRIAVVMLRALGVDTIRLLTNNPKKVDTLQRHGLHVAERLPLRIVENPHNQSYLSTKAKKSGHAL
jgi:GTP cyclohydrolase II